MKLWTAGVAAAFAVVASSAWAQDDKEAIKKRILDAVEKKLKAEEERILKEIGKIIDEELAKAKGVKPSKSEPKPDPTPPKPKARGRLGVRSAALSQEELDELGIKSGVRITEVVPGAAADKAGLKVDDIILSVDGTDVDARVLPEIIAKKGAGTEVSVKILRDKKEQEIKLKLGRHPDDPDPDAPQPKKDEPKAPAPSEDDLRERVKKFLDKEEGKKKDEPKSGREPADDEGGLALDDSVVEGARGLLERLGVDVEQYLEKGKDDKWRLKAEYRDLFKGLSPTELFKRMMPGEKPEAKKDEPKQDEPKKEGPKPAAKKPWLGVMPEELSDDVRAQLDIEEGVGLSVADVRPGSPAEKLLQKGDIILKIDGKPLRGEEALKKFIAGAKPGQECELTILRKGKQQNIKLALGERKD